MIAKHALFLLTILVWTIGQMHVQAQEIELREDLNQLFENHGTVGTFAAFDVTENKLIIIGFERAKEPKIPASTFKIANSLIALETGVIADVNEVIPYGGRPQAFKSWEQDMSIQDAIKISNVPIYQELSRRIGINNYKIWLQKLDYGNGQTGQNVEQFWLQGPLKISAIDQAYFLAKLSQKTLPASPAHQSVVAQIIQQEERDGKYLFAKTGWTTTPQPDIGWYVGWIESEAGIVSFALNMDMNSRRDAPNRELISRQILAALKLY